ncbi:hypothetical protein ACKUB1_06145 [Methanospirillum stamsii]|uniref:Uncharacterized protein n=1 Tax=Methanospirillum stamsii TaxID=1277351 RepID=A0A2V2N9A9_9EURY|nr:hypothetical protein [Methanospirillum stamsii]PWR75155.1 hypothetical protein DLD82_06125 [Methanospirillum stamsii]
MVLEEEIWFSSEGEAQECSRIFRKMNISAHIRTKVELENMVQYKAPYSALKGIIEEEIERIRSAEDDDVEELTESYQEMCDYLKTIHDLMEKTFTEKSPGDHIGTTVYDFFIKEGKMPEDEESMVAFFHEAVLIRVLELNNLIDINEEGMTLARTISPDDAQMVIFEDEIPPLREEALQKWNIQRSLESKDILSYIVTTSPDIVFLEDLTELENFFERIEYDPENLSFFVNLQVKQVLVAEIISMIQKTGKNTREQLIVEFIHYEFPIHDEMMGIGLHLSQDFIGGVLDDLKKTGILKGKDSKLKVII